jgi:uncharacterized repeat protein (TIGR01451 family)
MGTMTSAPTATNNTNSTATVRISKTGVTTNITAGKTYTYTLTPKITSSNCNAIARNVIITDILPAFLTYQAGSGQAPTQVVHNADGTTTLTWNLGNVATKTAVAPITYNVVGVTSTQSAHQGTSKVIISSTDDRSADCVRTQVYTLTYCPGVINRPNVILVKRITGINTTKFTTVFDPKTTNDANNNDGNAYWPTNYLQGGGVSDENVSPADPVRTNKIRPGDELEYTVYFLNAGNSGAKKVRICDLLTPNQTYVPGVSLTVGTGADKMVGSASQIQYVPAGGAIPSNCGIKAGDNVNGLVVIDVTNDRLPMLPAATVHATRSYGSVSFRTKVN